MFSNNRETHKVMKCLKFEFHFIKKIAVFRFFPVEQNNFNPSVWIQSCPDHNYNKDKGSQEYLWLFYTAALIIPIALVGNKKYIL